MAYHSRLPTPKGAQTIHPFHRMRSEEQLKRTPEWTLHRQRSLGQLSSPPDWPLPPIPIRSPLCPVSQTYGPSTPSNSNLSSSSQYSQDDRAGSDRGSGCNTMLIQDQIDQRKIRFALHRSSKQTPKLEDLSQLLHLRGRLQEMGTSFTAEGKMYTYGNPPLNSDLEEMLRLGGMYDEQWNVFFSSGKVEESDSNLWPDLKVLKKMLQNEGITFDDQYKRLNYGTSHPKLIRLSDQYDVLREEWLAKTLQDIHPAQRREHQHSSVEVEVPDTPTNLGWKFLLDDGGDGEDELVWKKSRRSSRLTIVIEEQPNVQNGPGPTIQNTTHPSPPIPPKSHASTQDVTDRVNPVTPGMITTMRSRGLTVGAATLLYGSSPLQSVEIASMLLRDAESEMRTISTVSEVNGVSRSVQERRHEHAGVLGFLVGGEKTEEIQKLKKSKGLRKWLRAVTGRRKDDQ